MSRGLGGHAHPKRGIWVQGESHPYAAEQARGIRAEDEPVPDQHSVHYPPGAVEYGGRKWQRIQLLQHMQWQAHRYGPPDGTAEVIAAKAQNHYKCAIDKTHCGSEVVPRALGHYAQEALPPWQ